MELAVMSTVLEVVFTGSKKRPEGLPKAYWAIPGHPTSLRIVFDVAGYLTGSWIEIEEDEILHFNKTHTIVANFFGTPDFWKTVENRIHIGMKMNAHAGSEIIGKAKLLEYEYHESYDIINGKVVEKE